MNAPYDIARFRMLSAQLNWPATDLRVIAWKGAKDFVATDQLVGTLQARALATVVGYSQTITSKSVSADGTAQTNQVLIPAVPIGDPVTFLTVVKHAVSMPSAELILFVDEAEGLPFVPNGLDMMIQPDWISERGWFRP